MSVTKAMAGRPALTDDMRAAMLGEDPFMAAYNALYRLVEFVYTSKGHVEHELIAMEFQAGVPLGGHAVRVVDHSDVQASREQLLVAWPMVVHVFEAWAAPDDTVRPSEHPHRYDIVSMMFHTNDVTASVTCRVDPEKKSIERAELVYPSMISGRLARPMPTRH